MNKTQYVVAVGQKDKLRLAIQHQTFAQGTEAFLNRLGIIPSMNVLVVGCGAGDETALIANKVGLSGQVTGIDISPEQINVARKKLSLEKFSNVKLQVLAAEELGNLNEQFDIVYCRMVLVHIKNPENILERMLSKVKVGGKLACEEPDISTCFTIPHSPAFKKHIHLLCSFMKSNGCDPDLGSKLYALFEAIECSNIQVDFSQPAVIDTYKKNAALLSAENCAPQYVSSGLITQEESETMVRDIEIEVVRPNDVLMGQCRMTQIFGIKNS
jgi:ubiquinone/menaquinone biosynthesis C-methylase UbiE